MSRSIVRPTVAAWRAPQSAPSRWRTRLTPEVLAGIVALIPDDWLRDREAFADAAGEREAYRRVLQARLDAPHEFVEEARRARERSVRI